MNTLSDTPLTKLTKDSQFVDALRAISYYRWKSQDDVLLDDVYGKLKKEFDNIASQCATNETDCSPILIMGDNQFKTLEELFSQFQKEQVSRFLKEMNEYIKRPQMKYKNFLANWARHVIVKTSKEDGKWDYIKVLFDGKNTLQWTDDFVPELHTNIKVKL